MASVVSRLMRACAGVVCTVGWPVTSEFEPGARLVAERAPEIADRPVAGGVAAEERHVDGVIRHIGVRDALVRIEQMIEMIVVDDHRAIGAQDLDPVGLAERRIAGRQRIAHAEIDHRAVGEGDDRPGDVMRAEAGLLENSGLAARNDLDRPVSLQEPAHQVHIICEHVEHRRGVRVTLKNCKSLRPRIVDPRQAADHAPEPPLDHLLLGAQEALLVAPAVADAQIASGLLQGREDRVGILQRHRDRLFDQHRLAELQRPADRRGVLAFRRRHDDRIDLRMCDDLGIVAGMELRARLVGQRLGARRVGVGNGDVADRGMLGCEPRAQSPDPSGADHRNAEIVIFHGRPCFLEDRKVHNGRN